MPRKSRCGSVGLYCCTDYRVHTHEQPRTSVTTSTAVQQNYHAHDTHAHARCICCSHVHYQTQTACLTGGTALLPRSKHTNVKLRIELSKPHWATAYVQWQTRVAHKCAGRKHRPAPSAALYLHGSPQSVHECRRGNEHAQHPNGAR